MHHNPIAIENLSYIYPDGTHALRGINLSIKANERVALMEPMVREVYLTITLKWDHSAPGRNGNDWRMVCHTGEFTRDSQFCGVSLSKPDDQLFMPTVWDDVAFGPMNQGLRDEKLIDRVCQAMAAVGIDPDYYGQRNTDNLSGGEKKRIAIAGVLAMNPQVLVFDEPSAQLDPRSRRQLINLLHSLPLTQLIATHDLDLALELCNRTVVLSQGEIVFDGQTEQVMSNPEFLDQHALESPLSYSRPYCQLKDAPVAMALMS
jgi:cobalt/nickel transport system ATP-binding protein